MSFQNLGQILGLGPPSTNQGEMGFGGGGGVTHPLTARCALTWNDSGLECDLIPS